MNAMTCYAKTFSANKTPGNDWLSVEGGLKVPSFKFIVDSVKLKCFLQIFDNDSEQVWALLVRQYFKTNNLDLSAAIKCPELSTCTKNLIFPSFYTKTFQLWDELIETRPRRK